MNKENLNLKRVIDTFLGHTNKLLKEQRRVLPQKIEPQKIQTLATSIWDLRHFAIELLESSEDETITYDALIIKSITEQPLSFKKNPTNSTTLIQAADASNKGGNHNILQDLVYQWSYEVSEKEVLFEDLQEISMELLR